MLATPYIRQQKDAYRNEQDDHKEMKCFSPEDFPAGAAVSGAKYRDHDDDGRDRAQALHKQVTVHSQHGKEPADHILESRTKWGSNHTKKKRRFIGVIHPFSFVTQTGI